MYIVHNDSVLHDVPKCIEVVVWQTFLFDFAAWLYEQPVRVCEGQSFSLDRLPDHPDVPVLYKVVHDGAAGPHPHGGGRQTGLFGKGLFENRMPWRAKK